MLLCGYITVYNLLAIYIASYVANLLSAACVIIYITEQVPLHAGVVNWMCAVLSYICTDLNISLHNKKVSNSGSNQPVMQE